MKTFISPQKSTLIYQKNKNTNAISIYIIFNTGSKHDGELYGITHLIEHLLLKENNKFSTKALASICKEQNNDLNGFTSFNEIALTAFVEVEKFQETMELLSSLIFEYKFKKTSIETEKKVVLEEALIRENKIEALNNNNMLRNIYGKEEFCKKRWILGFSDSINRITESDLNNQINSYFCAENLYIILSGNVTFSKSKKLVNKYFFKKIKQKQKASSEYDEITSLSSPALTVTHSELSMSMVNFNFEIEKYDGKNKRELLITSIINYSLITKFFNVIRNENGLCYDCGLYTFGNTHQSFLNFEIKTSKEKVNSAILETCKFIKKTKTINQQDLIQFINNFKMLKNKKLVNPSSYETMIMLYQDFKRFGMSFETKEKESLLKNITLKEINEKLKATLSKKPFVNITTNANISDIISYEEILKNL